MLNEVVNSCGGFIIWINMGVGMGVKLSIGWKNSVMELGNTLFIEVEKCLIVEWLVHYYVNLEEWEICWVVCNSKTLQWIQIKGYCDQGMKHPWVISS